jgi:hypothetical protein
MGSIAVDRLTRLLHGLDLAQAQGLEFGPLYRPAVQRNQALVYYVDHTDTDGLRAKYAADPAVPPHEIVPIDIVWSSGALREAVRAALPGRDKWFQYVIASHVIEHVPDVIWWLAELRSVMSSGGALRLIIPDRRFTMDIGRRETELADVLAAYLEARRRPQPRDILDFYTNHQKTDLAAAWRGDIDLHQPASMPGISTGIELARGAMRGDYHDVHCSVFTPRSFVALMDQLAQLGMIWFECERLYSTQRGELDFFVHMVAADDRTRIQQSWRAATVGRARALPQDDVATLREEIIRRGRVRRFFMRQLRRVRRK